MRALVIVGGQSLYDGPPMLHRPDHPVDVVFVGQLPPPVHGQAQTNLAMIRGHYDRIRITAVPMRFSDDVASVGRFRLTKLVRVPSLIWAVLRQHRVRRRDVLVYTVGANNVVGIARDLMVLPFIRPFFRRTVFFVHTGGIRALYDKPGLSALARFAYGRADVVIHTDRLVAGPEDQLPSPKTLAFLPHGLADPTLTGLLPSSRREAAAVDGGASPVILFVGNMYAAKGTHHLIRAGGLLAEGGHQFEIRFVGAAPTERTNAELLALARERGIAARVKVLGPVPRAQVWEQLADADMFCFPTRYDGEAFPIVILEAMAASLPVVSTRWRAVPAMVKEGITGFLVDPDDDVALADRLEALLVDPGLIQKMGKAGRARFEANYTLAEFEAGFERIVCSTL